MVGSNAEEEDELGEDEREVKGQTRVVRTEGREEERERETKCEVVAESERRRNWNND